MRSFTIEGYTVTIRQGHEYLEGSHYFNVIAKKNGFPDFEKTVVAKDGQEAESIAYIEFKH